MISKLEEGLNAYLARYSDNITTLFCHTLRIPTDLIVVSKPVPISIPNWIDNLWLGTKQSYGFLPLHSAEFRTDAGGHYRSHFGTAIAGP